MRFIPFLIVFIFSSRRANALNETSRFVLKESNVRFAQMRCAEKYADVGPFPNYADTPANHCYVYCLFYKLGLIDLRSRDLDQKKLQDVCEDFGFERVKDLPKSLSGRCRDYYKILVECKHRYRDLFEFIFNERSPKTTANNIGESATETCAGGLFTANNVDFLVKPVLAEQLKFVCIFANFHYLDAYQRVDVEEIMISYDEAQALKQHTREIVEDCAHRANALYKKNDYGDMALTLHKCLRRESSDYSKVFALRDKNSRKY
ncbi:uncharacterized protein LOC119635189 [Glossina fuscipes]|uniref:Uncharacterized protein LOC119635189 n=1 Tax=Glossina fuscipes TaxID=7396 RepID=A0A8U0WL23_9MUSC|nr:uncharacterized protein LOC119635189 [Glossina fuscipes]